MDPRATLRRLLDAIESSDTYEARLALEDLLGWRARGGFLPLVIISDEEVS